MTRSVVLIFSVGLMVLGAGMAFGQNYPSKPIRVVTADPGSGADFAARLISQGLTGALGQAVIVDNRGGANGIIAAQTVAKATPDAYTLLFYGNGFWLLPFLQNNVPYDPVRDFSPVTLVVRTPLIVAVNPLVPAKSVKELIALAKARPGELNYASGAAGGSNHLAAELFKAMAGVNIKRIPYKGPAPALNALIGGEIHVMFAAATVMSHVKSGRLMALAITSAQPSVVIPNLPTVAASGLLGYEAETLYGIFTPAKTPAALVNRLNQEIVRVLNTADVKEKFFTSGAETVGNLPKEFAVMVKYDMARFGKLIKDLGIRGD